VRVYSAVEIYRSPGHIGAIWLHLDVFVRIGMEGRMGCACMGWECRRTRVEWGFEDLRDCARAIKRKLYKSVAIDSYVDALSVLMHVEYHPE
jgi:hypothetical protein